MSRTGRQRGVNRVVIGVWDIDAAKEYFCRLLGAEFIETPAGAAEAAGFGVRAALAFNAGVELVSPLPEAPSGVRDALEARGEGLLGVVFAVEDADAARDAAVELGSGAYYSLDYGPTELSDKLEGCFTRYKEHFLADVGPLAGSSVLVGEFDGG